MWKDDQQLLYPIRVQKPNPQLARMILENYAAAGAAQRYLSQRYCAPLSEGKAMLTDIAAEELSHQELIWALVYRLTRDVKKAELAEKGLIGAGKFCVLTPCLPLAADPIEMLHENLAAEQKSRAAYETLLSLSDDPEVSDVLAFLRQREMVHYQRFGEILRLTQAYLENDAKENAL